MLHDPVDSFLKAIESGTVAESTAFVDTAKVDATVPNWRFGIEGADAIRGEFARWYADPGHFEELSRTPLPDGELVEFKLCWEQEGVPHAVHQVHILGVSPEGITSDHVWCGGRWPAPLLAEMEEAARASG